MRQKRRIGRDNHDDGATPGTTRGKTGHYRFGNRLVGDDAADLHTVDGEPLASAVVGCTRTATV